MSVPEYFPKRILSPDLDVEGELGPVVEDLAVAHGEDLALLGLLLGRVGDDDPSLGGLLLLDAADQQAVVKRTYFHVSLLQSVSGSPEPTYRLEAPTPAGILWKVEVATSNVSTRGVPFDDRRQELRDLQVGSAAVGFRVLAAVPQADAERFPAASRDEGDLVLEPLLLSKQGNDVLLEPLRELRHRCSGFRCMETLRANMVDLLGRSKGALQITISSLRWPEGRPQKLNHSR